MDHYRRAPYRASTLDPSLSQGITLSDTEKTNLVAFLKTLTDHEFLKDKRFEE
jgi:cytochrome c peroxidase